MSDRQDNSSSSEDERDENQRRDSNVSKLRRLASNPNYRSTLSLGVSSGSAATQENIGASNDSPPISPNMNAASDAFNDLLNGKWDDSKPTHRANIRKFVEKEFHKSTAAKELIRHLIFVVILIAGVTLHRSAFESYLMNQALITTFIDQEIDTELQPVPKSFLDIGQPDEFRDWLTSVVGDALDSKEFYSGEPKSPGQQDYIMFSNRLLGGVRLRQLRAAPNKDCKIPDQLRDITNTCYAYTYRSANRETEPFGPPENTTKYTYQSESETGSVSIFGYELDYLDGGGYVTDVNLEDRDNGETFTDRFQELINDTWIDTSTRAVIISMVFLNLELESRVAVLYLIIEIPGNGDYFRLFLEVLFVIFTAYAIYSEIVEMIYNHKVNEKGLKKYFFNGWNLIELLDIVLYITVMSLYIKYLASPDRRNAKLASRVYSSEMERLAANALIFYNLCAINVILTTARTFKYLKLNHKLYMLWKTLRHAGADLIGLTLTQIFLIFIFGFIFMGWLSFGSDMEEFNTFVHAFATCWTFIIGNAPDYNSMFRSNRILGPLFFVLFTIFIFFILANMFIAILSNSFEVINEDVEEDGKLKDIIEQKVVELIGNVRKLYLQITNKQESKKRSILHILDNLEHPEYLEKPKVTKEDVAKAIGPTATKLEIDELYQWTKKLENKTTRIRRNTKGGDDRSSRNVLMADYEDEEDRGERKSKPLADVFPNSPVIDMDRDTKEALKDLREQMQELKQILHRHHGAGSSSSNNNNHKD